LLVGKNQRADEAPRKADRAYRGKKADPSLRSIDLLFDSTANQKTPPPPLRSFMTSRILGSDASIRGVRDLPFHSSDSSTLTEIRVID
jgi:hypothetical protein